MPEGAKKSESGTESKPKPKPNLAEVRLRHAMSRKNPTGRALINMGRESMESISQGPNPWQAFKGWWEDQFTRPTNRAIELYQGFKDGGVEPPQIPSYEALVGRPGVVDPLSYSTGTLKLLRGGSGALKRSGKFDPEEVKMVRSLGVEDLAKRFGLIYNGPQEGVGGQIKVQLFTDPKTGGTFGVGPDPTYKDVAKGLKELRLRFKPEQPVTIKEFKKAKRSDDLKTLLNKVKTGQWGEQREAPVGWFNEMVDKHTNLMNSAKKSGDLEGYARAKANLDAIKTFWKPKGGK